jgi:hypothetical protein
MRFGSLYPKGLVDLILFCLLISFLTVDLSMNFEIVSLESPPHITYPIPHSYWSNVDLIIVALSYPHPKNVFLSLVIYLWP